MNTKLSFRDFLWVLMAFLRGKVLRQKNYRPHGNAFPSMPGATIQRMLPLMNWWGYRPMTMEEVMLLMQTKEPKDRPGYVPYVSWTDKSTDVDWLEIGWKDNSCRFLRVPRNR